ncbi:sulfotransferase family cytosolic 1B member 1-like [Ceratina calcarata]|nr:sulfotransferase family cytosolic 1B member 1-like [Ceratina calcarata]
MFYEDMKHDFPKAMKQVAKFLGKSYTEEQLKKLAEYLDIKNFRDNPMVNSTELKECGVIESGVFVRKGQSGGWKDMFSPELNARANEWIKENMKKTDIRFPYFDIFNDSN